MNIYAHVTNPLARAVCEGMEVTLAELDPLLHYMAKCVDEDNIDESISSETYRMRSNLWDKAWDAYFLDGDKEAAIAYIQRFWRV